MYFSIAIQYMSDADSLNPSLGVSLTLSPYKYGVKLTTSFSCALTEKGAISLQFLLLALPAGKYYVCSSLHSKLNMPPIPVALTAIRVYALRRSLLLSCIALVLSLAPVGVNFVISIHGTLVI